MDSKMGGKEAKNCNISEIAKTVENIE
jgi:hypothetical protein